MNYWLIAGSWIAASILVAWAWLRAVSKKLTQPREGAFAPSKAPSEGIWPSQGTQNLLEALEGYEREFAEEVIEDIAFAEQFVAEREGA